MDREYAICFEGKNGLEEIGVSPRKADALSQARYYLKHGAKNMVLKYYEEGDLKHQWDYQNGKWKQYE